MAREGFVYRGRTAEDVDAQANQSGSSFDKFISDRFPTWKVEKGDRIVRVLPPTFNSKKYGKHWGLKVFIHRNVGAKDGQYLCLDEMKGEECPICEFAKKLEADGENDDAYKLRKQFLYIAWVIDRDAEKEGPMVWTVPWTLDREIGVRCKDKKTGEAILIDDPEDGFDVEFRRDGTGLGTKYLGVNISRESCAISDNPKRQAKWLAFINETPLNEVLNFYEAEYLEKVVNATTSDDDDEKPKKKKRPSDDDDDEDEKPKKKKRPSDDDDDDEPVPKKKKKPVADYEDDDVPVKKKKTVPEDDDEDDAPPPKKKRPSDDDDDEPAPKKKGGGVKRVRADVDDDDDEPVPKKKKPVEDDDEDEDDDPSSSAKAALKTVGKKKRPSDDDDDEDEKPKKKKRPSDDDDDDEPVPKKKKKPVADYEDDD